MKAFQPKNIKEHNQNLIVELLKNCEFPMTTRQLSEVSHLSVVTLNKLIPELIGKDSILAVEEQFKTGGRFAAAYTFNANKQQVLILQCIEAYQKLTVNYVVVDLLGNILEKFNFSTNTLEDLLSNISKLKTKYPKLSLVVSGIPGVEINGDLKIMDYAPFKNLNLKKEITDKTGITITVENDINAAAFGYSQTNKVLAAIYFPEEFPPGSALIFNQNIFKGNNNMSGEIKYLPTINPINFPLRTSDIEQTITEAIQSVIAMYDPHEVVLFISKKWLDYLDMSHITEELDEIFPNDTLAKITVSHDFSKYYLDGLIKIGLTEISMTE